MEYDSLGVQSFMANLLPDAKDVIEAQRIYIERLFAEPARKAGAQRWGIKEVRYKASFLDNFRLIFPDTAAVHVTRHPVDVLQSLEAWERSPVQAWDRLATIRAFRRWIVINESFLAAEPSELTLTLKLEDVISRRDEVMCELEALTHLSLGDFAREVLDTRIHSVQKVQKQGRSLRSRDEIRSEFCSLLRDSRLQRIATAYSFDIGI